MKWKIVFGLALGFAVGAALALINRAYAAELIVKPLPAKHALAPAPTPQSAKTVVDIKAPVAAKTPVHAAGSGLPDLIVTDLFIASKEVRFKVKNIGSGEKAPAELHYILNVSYLNSNGGVVSSMSVSGIAAITSLYRLQSGQTAGDDRVAPTNFGFGEWMRLELCINPDALVAEENTTNNCLTRTSQQVLPDLEVVSGRIEIFQPKSDDDPWYEKVGSFLWDTITLNHQFDVSGVPLDRAIVVIRNNGGAPVANFKVSVGITRGGQQQLVYETIHTDVIAPGEIRRALVYIGSDKTRWSDPNCCTGIAALDGSQKIAESNEGNNKLVIGATRVRDHR